MPCTCHLTPPLPSFGRAARRPAVILAGLLVCWLAASADIHAAGAGFRTIGIWNHEEQVRLDICVWYPVQASASTVRYGEWALRVNRRAKPIEGRFPLVVISHDTMGDRFAHHNLAASLASQGFIVAAPTHNKDNFREMGHVFTEQQLVRRLAELEHTLDAVLSDETVGPVIDTNRIGLLGFGTGGATALLAAGGRISPHAWDAWKDAAPAGALYMHAWTRSRLEALAESQRLRRNEAEPRFRAVAVAAPAYSMFFDRTSLERIRTPILLIAVEDDPLNPAPDFLSRLQESLPGPVTTAFIPQATPYSLLALPEGRQSETLPYAPPNPRLHAQVFTELNKEVSRFFLSAIGDPNLPPAPPSLPPAPDLTESELPDDMAGAGIHLEIPLPRQPGR